MPQNAKKRCLRYGLTHVETKELTLRRRRCGKGFVYLDAKGTVLSDQTQKARIKQLAIPPAWTDVCVATDERAHIQAIGRDTEGRLQYRYHSDWDKLRAEIKRHRLLHFGTSLGRVRAAVKAALIAPGLTRTKIIAAIVRLIDRALLRPGYEEYARKEGGRGAATLMKNDVSIEGDQVLLDFAGKGGKEVKLRIRDPLLAGVITQLLERRGRRLFSTLDRDGEHPVTAKEVNGFLAEVSGAPVSAKDFRTFRASASAVAFLTQNNNHQSGASRKKSIVQAADRASEVLANTRMVARSSYIHPSVIEAYEAGNLETSLLQGRLRRGLNKVETALMRFLEGRSREVF
jgi:DNA topoisomerase-1